MYTPPPGRLVIHVSAFEFGVRLPLHPSLCRLLIALELAPLQLSPGFWKNLTGFLVLWKEQCEKDGVLKEPRFDKIRYVYQLVSMVPRSQFYLRP